MRAMCTRRLSRDCDTLRNVTRLELCHLKRTRINEGAAPSSITYVSIIVGGAVCATLLFYVLFKASSTGPAPYDPAKVKIN